MTTCSAYFDHVYVLNLAERTDRLAHMRAELRRLDMALGTPTVRRFEAIRPPDRGGFTSIGTRGALLSHRAALRTALDDGATRPLILEDDAVFSPLLVAQQEAICRELEERDWDIVQLGHMVERDGRPGATYPGEADARDVAFEVFDGEVIGAHCYSVRGDRIRLYLDFLDELLSGTGDPTASGPMPIDGTFNVFSWRPDVTRLIARPSVVGQMSSRSDVTPSRLDRIAVLRPAMALARRLGLTRGRLG